MPARKTKEETPKVDAAETSVPETIGATEEEEAVVEAPRRQHVVTGRIPRDVVKSEYDPRQDAVIDHIEIVKEVRDGKGEMQTVTHRRRVLSQNETLQNKHRRGDEVVEVFEVTDDV